MNYKIPKHFSKREDTHKKRSQRQESKVAAVLGGRVTINSGATLGENDVVNDFCEVECKTTTKSSFSLKMGTWELLLSKCNPNKIPAMVIDFDKDDKSLAVLDFEDFKFLIDLANKNSQDEQD